MNKTIIIDGNNVPLKITASFPYRYKAQFGHDILKVIMPIIGDLIPLAVKMRNFESVDDLENENEDVISELVNRLDGIEMTTLFNIVWILAKTADKNIPEPEEWLDEFDAFPLGEILPEVLSLIIETFATTQEPKQKN